MHQPSPDHAVVTFTGPDATSFLQSQLTNDVAALSVGQWQWQGYCSAKGRLLATFALVRTGDAAYAAVVHQSVAPSLHKRLTMFRLRSKLDIAVSSTLVPTLHLSPPEPAPPAGRIATLDLGHGRWVTLDTGDAQTSLNAPIDRELPAGDDAFMQQWGLIGIESAQPEITAATAEMFVPQMIGWDTVQPGGGVNFGKGCYPGQEIVARAHYRGAVKRHLERVVLNDALPTLTEGAETTLSDGRIGEICNIVRRNDAESHALLVVQPH